MPTSFEWVRPTAGAIAFAKVKLPGSTTELVERIRTEQSVLLVSGEMFGIDNGIRFGFGYDIEHTLKGLSKVDDLLTDGRGDRHTGTRLPARRSGALGAPVGRDGRLALDPETQVVRRRPG